MERRPPRDDLSWAAGDFSSPYSSSSINNRNSPENPIPDYNTLLLQQLAYQQLPAPSPVPEAPTYNPYPQPRNSLRSSNNSSYQDNSSGVLDLESQMGNLNLNLSRDVPSWNSPNDSILADKLLMNPQLNNDYPYDNNIANRLRQQAILDQFYLQQAQAAANVAAMGMYPRLDDSNPLLSPYLYNNGLGSRSNLFGSSAYAANNGGGGHVGSLLRSSASGNRYPNNSLLNQNYQNSNGYGLDNDYGNGNGNGNFFRSTDNLRRRSNNNPRSSRNSMMSSMYNSNSSSSNSLLGGGGGSSRLLGNLSSLDELKGNIVEVACDKKLSQLLLKKFEEGTDEEVEMIFMEVKDNLLGLMENQLEKFLIEGFFRFCNEEQIYQILVVLVSDEERLEKICTTGHGTRRMQELLQNLSTQEHKDVIIPSLAKITLSLTMSDSGHHVILKCLGLFNPEENNHLFSVVTKHFYEIATDKSGCCVIQQCVDKATGEAKELLMAEVISNAAVLSEHPYGNYVVQYILFLHIPHVTEELLNQLEGNFVTLSMNKYGSNVVEKCLQNSNDEQVARIIKEIIDSQHVLMVFQNAFGNYVAQCAIDRSKGAVRHNMQELVLAHSHHLHSHPHGKRVLAKFKPSRPRGY